MTSFAVDGCEERVRARADEAGALAYDFADGDYASREGEDGVRPDLEANLGWEGGE